MRCFKPLAANQSLPVARSAGSLRRPVRGNSPQMSSLSVNRTAHFFKHLKTLVSRELVNPFAARDAANRRKTPGIFFANDHALQFFFLAQATHPELADAFASEDPAHFCVRRITEKVVRVLEGAYTRFEVPRRTHHDLRLILDPDLLKIEGQKVTRGYWRVSGLLSLGKLAKFEQEQFRNRGKSFVSELEPKWQYPQFSKRYFGTISDWLFDGNQIEQKRMTKMDMGPQDFSFFAVLSCAHLVKKLGRNKVLTVDQVTKMASRFLSTEMDFWTGEWARTKSLPIYPTLSVSLLQGNSPDFCRLAVTIHAALPSAANLEAIQFRLKSFEIV